MAAVHGLILTTDELFASQRTHRITSQLWRFIQFHIGALSIAWGLKPHLITTCDGILSVCLRRTIDRAALPVTEAYRLIATHGLGFTATVEEWLLRGYHLPQALALAAQGRGTEMVAMQRLAAERDFPLTRLASSLKPAACRGCQHYYGRIDGMHRLVCAMHPYGPDADRCEDWKAFDRS